MIIKIIQETIKNLDVLMNDKGRIKTILQASSMICQAIRNGKKLMICGNGGSAADAQHIAGEFVCRFLKDRAPMSAVALTTDTSVLTSIANDYSYTHVFDRQVRAIGKAGDVLLGISTSGKSENVLNAFIEAKKIGVQTVLLTGDGGGDQTRRVDLVIRMPSCDTPRVQEMHLLIEHIIADLVERDVHKDA